MENSKSYEELRISMINRVKEKISNLIDAMTKKMNQNEENCYNGNGNYLGLSINTDTLMEWTKSHDVHMYNGDDHKECPLHFELDNTEVNDLVCKNDDENNLIINGTFAIKVKSIIGEEEFY